MQKLVRAACRLAHAAAGVRRTTLNESLAPQTVSKLLACAILPRLSFLPPPPSGQKSAANPFYNLGKHSARRNAPSKEGVPTVFGRIVLLVPINGFATSRTKSNMNRPSAVADVTETGAPFHSFRLPCPASPPAHVGLLLEMLKSEHSLHLKRNGPLHFFGR
jgi:hypothetical protein